MGRAESHYIRPKQRPLLPVGALWVRFAMSYAELAAPSLLLSRSPPELRARGRRLRDSICVQSTSLQSGIGIKVTGAWVGQRPTPGVRDAIEVGRRCMHVQEGERRRRRRKRRWAGGPSAEAPRLRRRCAVHERRPPGGIRLRLVPPLPPPTPVPPQPDRPFR
jgi:hypothetical protein